MDEGLLAACAVAAACGGGRARAALRQPAAVGLPRVRGGWDARERRRDLRLGRGVDLRPAALRSGSTVCVFYFFPLRAALLHMASIGGGVRAVLTVEDLDYSAVAGWLATIGTLLVTGLLIAAVRTRVAGLVANLTNEARRTP